MKSLPRAELLRKARWNCESTSLPHLSRMMMSTSADVKSRGLFFMFKIYKIQSKLFALSSIIARNYCYDYYHTTSKET